ncbi:hypothetical protein SB912_32995, partial [Pantoea sp. SIMBA_072]
VSDNLSARLAGLVQFAAIPLVECPIQSVVAILQIKQVLECLITEALQPYSLLLELDVTEPSVQYPQAGAQQLQQAGTGFAA